MAALAEGLNILHGADAGLRPRDADAETAPLDHPEFYAYTLDLPAIAEVWRRGSVVESWLLDLTAAALHESPDARRLRRARLRLGRGALDGDRGDRGGRAGRRAHRSALRALPLPRARETSRTGQLSAMRKQFGGHQEKPVGEQTIGGGRGGAWTRLQPEPGRSSPSGAELAEIRGGRAPASPGRGRPRPRPPRAGPRRSGRRPTRPRRCS